MRIFLSTIYFFVLKDRFSKLNFFEVILFRSHSFSKSLISKRTDRFQIDRYLKWSISKSPIFWSSALSKLFILEVPVFEGLFFWSDCWQKSKISKKPTSKSLIYSKGPWRWSISKWPDFRSDKFWRHLFAEMVNLSKSTIFEVTDYLVTNVWKWSIKSEPLSKWLFAKFRSDPFEVSVINTTNVLSKEAKMAAPEKE